VIPRSRGGNSTWENLVACCHACNRRKGNRMLSEIDDMILLREPRPFSLHTSRQIMRMLGRGDDRWRKYLFYLCHGSRDAEDGRVEFHFSGGRTFQGKYRTRTTDSIEGDIWQAGGEPDALILGISFDTGKQILLNTLHIANPGKQTSSQLDKDLFITTYPVPVR
jgi:hypothetical protein